MGQFRASLSSTFSKHQILRWGVYGAIIGSLSGIAACTMLYALEWGSFFLLERLAGYHMTKPAGEHLVPLVSHAPLRLWVLLLLPAIGGIISGLIVYTWAPEAEGDGTEAFIDTFHNKKGLVRPRVPFLKGVASIITIITGGSAGREGPIAQVGAGLGSWIGQILKLSVRERRLLLLAGCAGGLGAIFRAPLGGALTAIEVLYREDFETEGIILCIISSVVANSVVTTIFGTHAIFDIPPIKFSHPFELAAYGVLGLACVPLGALFVTTYFGLRDHFFRKIRLNKALIPAIGGIMVGIVGMWKPQAMGGGYGTIQQALLGQLPMGLLFTLSILKIATTSFTISSGGSGGVFGPALFIGAAMGGAVGQLGHHFFPHIVTNPGAFALVGMGAFFAGVAKAPVGALLMVCEMTGGYSVVIPLMFTSVLVILLTQRWNLYRMQLLNKFQSPAHQSERVINLLQSIRVDEVYHKEIPVPLLPEDMTFAQLKRFMARTRESFFPVVDESFRLKGILSFPYVREVLFDKSIEDLLVVGELSLPPVSIGIDETLYDAFVKFLQSGYSQIPIENNSAGVVGLLRLKDLMEAYHHQLKVMQEE